MSDAIGDATLHESADVRNVLRKVREAVLATASTTGFLLHDGICLDLARHTDKTGGVGLVDSWGVVRNGMLLPVRFALPDEAAGHLLALMHADEGGELQTRD